MSRYIFIGTEKDLIDNGFYDKETTLNKKISNRHVIIFDKNNQTLVGKYFSFVDLEVFPFDITNAIQDLIVKGLVKEKRK